MTEEVLNRDLLPGNVCFGCGHANPKGLGVEVVRDPSDPERLIGTFDPPAHMIGFPGITHGGAIYTALDCIAAWTPMVLRPDVKAIWILRSATITYLRPAHQGRPLRLASRIESEGRVGHAVEVQAEARDSDGNVLAEGLFKVVPLVADRFVKVAGIDRLPENWRHFLGVEDIP
jgi:acyl-coenzyme A thioesterase PaaI-like protein